MRRQWLWLLSLVAALVVVGLLMLAFTRPAPPYDFLHGLQAGKPPEHEIHVEHGIREWDGSSSYYRFEADYATVVRKARDELLHKGFEEAAGPASEAFFQRSDTEIVPTRVQNVVIRRGRYGPGPTPDGKEVLLGENTPTPGWVTVFVYGLPDPGPLERLASWLGF